MTIAMPDDIIVANLPDGYPAYLGYVDGKWPTAAAVRARFPSAHVLTLTVLGGSAVADGCDREPGDLSPASAAAWLHWRISSGAWRPVLYDSRDDVPDTLGQLAAVGVKREQFRILSAHYGAGEHICGPSTCRAAFQADGTQWTDTFRGVGGALIDMSLLDDSFFGTPPPPADWTFGPPRDLLARAGHESVALTWQPPAGAPVAPDHYLVYIYRGSTCNRTTLVASYPREAKESPWQGGSLRQGQSYTAHVVASGPGGTRVRPYCYASAAFTTG